jgi:hypothetical protein
MAVVSGAAKVPDARIAGVALTVQGDKALAATTQALELDCGKRVVCRQEG